jgi:hypothetical protein
LFNLSANLPFLRLLNPIFAAKMRLKVESSRFKVQSSRLKDLLVVVSGLELEI